MMKINKTTLFFTFVLAVFVVFWESGLVCSSSETGFIRMKSGGLLGWIGSYKGNRNNGEIESIGRFAVQEHNKKQNSLLEFGRVIKVKEQVVSGKLYHLTLEAVDAGKKRIYEAKVWVKPWVNFKKLEDFRYTSDASSFTSSDLGVKRGH